VPGGGCLYLSGAALAFEPLAETLGSDLAAATLPVLITGSMLFTFRPRGKEWWEYLDQIWDATMTAENLDDPVLPAVQDHQPPAGRDSRACHPCQGTLRSAPRTFLCRRWRH
jgi:hypothetical protein